MPDNFLFKATDRSDSTANKLGANAVSEHLALLFWPLHRKLPKHIADLKIKTLCLLHHRLNNIWREQGQPEHATNVGWVDLLGCSHFLD